MLLLPNVPFKNRVSASFQRYGVFALHSNYDGCPDQYFLNKMTLFICRGDVVLLERTSIYLNKYLIAMNSIGANQNAQIKVGAVTG